MTSHATKLWENIAVKVNDSIGKQILPESEKYQKKHSIGRFSP